MKTTVTIDAELLERAKESLGISDPARAVEVTVRYALHSEASKRLAALGGTMPDLEYPKRYRLGLEQE